MRTTRSRALAVALMASLTLLLAREARAADSSGASLQTAPSTLQPAADETPRDDLGRKKKAFAFSVGLQGGVTYFTEGTPFGTAIGIGRALTPGPNIGVRASFEFLSWLAIDARGLFTSNEGNNYVGLGSLTTVGGFGAVRFTLPFYRVRPYAYGGLGGYSISAAGTSTQLVSSSVAAYEAGIGALVPLSRRIDVGVEYGYAHFLGEVLSSNPDADGGDPSNLSVFAQYRFEL